MTDAQKRAILKEVANHPNKGTYHVDPNLRNDLSEIISGTASLTCYVFEAAVWPVRLGMMKISSGLQLRAFAISRPRKSETFFVISDSIRKTDDTERPAFLDKPDIDRPIIVLRKRISSRFGSQSIYVPPKVIRMNKFTIL